MNEMNCAVAGSTRGANTDRLTTGDMHTLPPSDVVNDHRTGAAGNYLPSRVISTISPVVVRQNAPNSPKYQEALGYSFLLSVPKYPGLTKMDDGTLVLTVTAALSGGLAYGIDEGHTDVILFSRDDGMTWSKPESVPRLPDGRGVNTDVAPSMLIEGDTIRSCSMPRAAER